MENAGLGIKPRSEMLQSEIQNKTPSSGTFDSQLEHMPPSVKVRGQQTVTCRSVCRLESHGNTYSN
jgi:hypothetical protein